MPKITRKIMTGQINGQEGREIEVTFDIPIFAEFDPMSDLTAYELAWTRAVIGEYRTFMKDEWEALGTAQRHWTPRNGVIPKEKKQEG